MLSEDNKQVFEALKKLTGADGNFKVIEADEIMSVIPNGKTMTKVQLAAIIRDLRDRDYLKVKYLTPDEYCLLTLPHIDEIHNIVEEMTAVATAVPQTVQPQKAVVKEKPRKARVASFVCAFFGAFFGGGVAMAAAILIQKFLL